MRWVIRVAMALALLALPASAQAPRRVALVIANANYQVYRPLPNAAVDSGLVVASLRRAGFSVVESWPDQGAKAMRDRLAAFQRTAAGADLALIYFAGHGMEVGGRNWLVPVDADIAADNELEFKAISADLVIQSAANARARIVVLDACRNNPLANRMRTTTRTTRDIGSGGLGQQSVQGVVGTLLMFSAGPGELANDGPAGQGSPFARAFSRWLPEPGVELRLAVGSIAEQVRRETGDQQPFSTTSLSGEPVYLNGAPTRDPELERQLREARDQLAALQREKAQGWGNGAGTPSSPAVSGPAVAVQRPDAGGVARAPGAPFRDCPDCPEMASIPAGSFTMGDNASGESDERPVREVSIRAFAAGRYEVTLGEWKAFVAATGRAAPPADCYTSAGRNGSWRNTGFAQDDRHPVACLNWNDAQDYVRWLSQRTGQRYRLLTEAEWEYVARAGTTGPYWFGQTVGAQNANYNASGKNGTVQVGGYAANAFGLHDTAGNVWEWVEDCHASTYAGAPTDGSPVVNTPCSSRVIRGGSWYDTPANLRSADRNGNAPSIRSIVVGFRVARTP